MPKKEVTPSVSIRILKIGTCTSLSGRSVLTYHLACNAEEELYLRVVGNSSSGQFNADPVPLSLIEQLLSAHPADTPITSAVLHPVFRGKSSNSPAFMFAVLKAESLVLALEGKDGGYRLGDLAAFKQAVSALIARDTNVETADLPPELSQRKQRRKEAA